MGDISAGSHGEVAAAIRSAAVASKKVGDISAGSHGEVAAAAQSAAVASKKVGDISAGSHCEVAAAARSGVAGDTGINKGVGEDDTSMEIELDAAADDELAR